MLTKIYGGVFAKPEVQNKYKILHKIQNKIVDKIRNKMLNISVR